MVCNLLLNHGEHGVLGVQLSYHGVHGVLCVHGIHFIFVRGVQLFLSWCAMCWITSRAWLAWWALTIMVCNLLFNHGVHGVLGVQVCSQSWCAWYAWWAWYAWCALTFSMVCNLVLDQGVHGVLHTVCIVCNCMVSMVCNLLLNQGVLSVPG